MLMTPAYWQNLKTNPAYGGLDPDSGVDIGNGNGDSGAGTGNSLHPSGFLSASHPGDSMFSGAYGSPSNGSGFNLHGRDFWMQHLTAPAQALLNQSNNGQPIRGRSPQTPNATQLYPWLFNSGLNFNPHLTMLNRLRPSSGVQFSPVK